VNPLVRQVIGEAATPDEFNAKDYLLSMPQHYSGYRVHISADPMAWSGAANTGDMDRCLLYAKKLAEMLKDQFPGIQTDISLGPNTFPSMGLDASVMEWIDSWTNDHFVEAVTAVDGP